MGPLVVNTLVRWEQITRQLQDFNCQNWPVSREHCDLGETHTAMSAVSVSLELVDGKIWLEQVPAHSPRKHWARLDQGMCQTNHVTACHPTTLLNPATESHRGPTSTTHHGFNTVHLLCRIPVPRYTRVLPSPSKDTCTLHLEKSGCRFLNRKLVLAADRTKVARHEVDFEAMLLNSTDPGRT